MRGHDAVHNRLSSQTLEFKKEELMAVYSGAAVLAGSEVVCANATVDYASTWVQTTPGGVHWGGKLLPPNNTGLREGEVYTLNLPGFTPCAIRITSKPNPFDNVVEFTGIGPQPAGHM